MTIEEFQNQFAKATKGQNVEYWRTREGRAHGLDSDCEKNPNETVMQNARQCRDYARRLEGMGKVSLVQKRLNCGETAYLCQIR